MNRIFSKTRVFALSISEETMNLFVLIQYQSVTNRQTDIQTERRTDISAIAIQAHAWLLCYRAGKNSCLSLSFLQGGRPPDSLPGICFWIPLGDFRPRDSFASHHLISTPEYAPELGAAFSTPAFSVNPLLT